MIQAESDPVKRDEYLQRLMELPNRVSVGFVYFILFILVFILEQSVLVVHKSIPLLPPLIFCPFLRRLDLDVLFFESMNFSFYRQNK